MSVTMHVCVNLCQSLHHFYLHFDLLLPCELKSAHFTFRLTVLICPWISFCFEQKKLSHLSTVFRMCFNCAQQRNLAGYASLQSTYWSPIAPELISTQCTAVVQILFLHTKIFLLYLLSGCHLKQNRL